MAYANAVPSPPVDGITCCLNVPLPALEGALGSIIPTPYHQGIVATVTLAAQGVLGSNASYVVVQGSNDGTNWVDLAWCVWAGTSGSATFLLAAGAFTANAFQQTRAVGTAPASNGSNQCQLPGQLRFVGKATVGAGSSSSSSGAPAVTPAVLATITYRQIGLR